MAVDNSAGVYLGLPNSPASRAFTVAPADGADLPFIPNCIWVGGAGNITCWMENPLTPGAALLPVVFTAVPAGTRLDIRPSRILATGTTATLMVALLN